MSVPIIGITTRKENSSLYKISLVASPRSYTEAIIKSGAIPLLIPLNLPQKMFKDLLERIDGVIFTGGGDIEIEMYNGKNHPEVYDVDEERDKIELELVQNIADMGKPLLGICRGLQIINIAFGGDLYTHISDQVDTDIEHKCFPDFPWDHIAHKVKINEGSMLAKITHEPILNVNSLHHQGIKNLSDKLISVATSADGLVEAVELKDYKFGLGVQWHPEWLPNDENMQSIFSSFIEVAK